MSGIKIAFMGIRGVPASYSGFETFVEQLGPRLAARGYSVSVYNRSTHVPVREKTYKDMDLVYLPTIPTKHLDTIVHTFLSVLHAAFRRFDIVYICGVGSAMLSFIPRLYGSKVVENVDGADWERKKWGGFASWFLHMSERMATVCPTAVIADSIAVQAYYKKFYGKETHMIPYGALIFDPEGVEFLEKFHLKKGQYVLFVGRLVPENNAHVLIEAFRGLSTDLSLVIVGENPYDRDYVESLRKMAHGDPRIVFTGFVFGRGYHQISSNAFLFVLPAEVGGTHPVLLEAMAFGNCVLVNDTEANCEVVGDAGLTYKGAKGPAELREKLSWLFSHPEDVKMYGAKARHRIREKYSWETVTEDYDRFFHSLLGR